MKLPLAFLALLIGHHAATVPGWLPFGGVLVILAWQRRERWRRGGR